MPLPGIFIHSVRLRWRKMTQELDDAAFKQSFIVENAIKAHPRQVDRLVPIIRHVFHERSSDRWRMLNAMATATGSHEEITMVWVITDDEILVKVVVIVVASPCTHQLQTYTYGNSDKDT